ncbi:MAG: hypothetical protein EXX96DRAFT_511179 [Benjaminiella poitrasii]|nr:MAG: hypothetical protein EXX96DRAFT_511179 [Benjaminiella poitrasii]
MSNEEWERKLLGKILVQDDIKTELSNDQIVKINELPEFHRVLRPGQPQTRDFRPNRLNVFVDDSYKIERVYYG